MRVRLLLPAMYWKTPGVACRCPSSRAVYVPMGFPSERYVQLVECVQAVAVESFVVIAAACWQSCAGFVVPARMVPTPCPSTASALGVLPAPTNRMPGRC